jgi:hypothetical protein
MEMDYYKKYLKYKMKYIELSKRMGGAKFKKSERKPHTAGIKKGPKISVSDRIKSIDLINIDRDIISDELTLHKLSGKIQWLVDFAGSTDVMDSIIIEFTGGAVEIKSGNNNHYNKPKTMYFYTSSGDSGHWIYIDAFGNQQQSYTNGHQKTGTNQFCQSFALIYMLNDNGESTFFNQLKSVADAKTDEEKYRILGDNIQVVLSMWHYYIFTYCTEEMRKWILQQFKTINDEYIEGNKGKRASGRVALIADNTDLITFELIKDKMIDINTYRVDIARST